MKIGKFNESATEQQKELNDFVKFFIDKYDININVNNYNCYLSNHKIIMGFYFNIIDQTDIETLQEINNYIKKFDKNVKWFISINHEMIYCYYNISLIAYKDIYDDMELFQFLVTKCMKIHSLSL